MRIKDLKNKAVTFLYSALSGFKFNIGGQLGANEILAITGSFSPKSWRNLYRTIPDIKKVNAAYFVLFLSQVLSDIVNQSSSDNFIRGWANILMAIIVTNFLAKLLWKSENAIIAYFIGSIISLTFWGVETEGVTLEDMGFFKYRLAPILNAALMILAWYFLRLSPRFRLNIVFLFVLYGLFNIAFDSRSNGMIFILMAIILYKKNALKSMNYKKMLPYILIFAIVFQALYSLYVSQVLSGKIGGEHSREQFAMTSNPYNPVNLLLAGRSEVYIAMLAIADKPVFGHGSWAPDPGGKYTRIGYRMQGEGDRFENLLQSKHGNLIIPSHSVLFGAWMTSGILGFGAMLWIIILFFKRGMVLLMDRNFQRTPFYPILLLYLTGSIWTFLFSPLPHIKQTLPVTIAFVLVAYRRSAIALKKPAAKNHTTETASEKLAYE